MFHRLECKDIDLQITFPPNVKSIQLIDDNEVATLLPESISAQLLVSSALPESLKSIQSWNEPTNRNADGPHVTPLDVYKRAMWERARREAQQAIKGKGITFTFLTREHY